MQHNVIRHVAGYGFEYGAVLGQDVDLGALDAESDVVGGKFAEDVVDAVDHCRQDSVKILDSEVQLVTDLA